MNLISSTFNDLLQIIADGWHEGNARTAADCFGQEAIYIEPPEKELYHGHSELSEFFGGDSSPDIVMKMTWHHLVFNEEEQIGFGEYTFEMHRRFHGIVMVKTEIGLIKQWREYQCPTELNWEEFTSHNPY